MGALVSGCAPRAASTAGSFDSASAPEALLDPIISPSALREQVGIELRWWAMRDDPDAIKRAVGPYLDRPSPLDAAATEHLAKAGLRVVALPMKDLLSVRSQLPIVGRIDRRWVGLSPAWVEGVTGPTFDDGRTVQVAGELIRLRAGELRLAVRAFTEPTVDGASLRFDLAVQHVDAQHLEGKRTALDVPTVRRTIMDAGQVFGTTIAQFTADGDSFYLLLSDDPDWVRQRSNEKKKSDENEKSPEPTEPEQWSPAPMVGAGQVEGPPTPALPTLGEALLSSPASADGKRSWRAIVAIVPRVGGASRLLP